MASLLSTATQAAHSAAVSFMSSAEIKPGASIPTKVPVKEEEATQTLTFEGIKGRNIFVRILCGMYAAIFMRTAQVGVPGAFTGTCSAQIPGYIKAYPQFKEKGVDNIYVVAVNDVFTLK